MFPHDLNNYFPAGRRSLDGSKEALEEVVRSLIVKLIEEDGGAPLVVRAAVHAVGHQPLVWLMRCWDLLPSRPQLQLQAVLEAHVQEIKKDRIGCIVFKAQAGYL